MPLGAGIVACDVAFTKDKEPVCRHAQKLIDESEAAGVPPSKVWPQSFHQPDVLYWVDHEPACGRQAVYLDDADADAVVDQPTLAALQLSKALGHPGRWQQRLLLPGLRQRDPPRRRHVHGAGRAGA